MLDSLVQWIVGFTGPVDFWIHWSSEFTIFTDLNFDGRLKETATCRPATAGKNGSYCTRYFPSIFDQSDGRGGIFFVQTVLFADFPCARGIELCKHENRD